MSQNNKNQSEEEQEKDFSTESTTQKTDNLSEKDSLKEQLTEEKDRYLRLFAEFDNYKKRTSKEKIDILKYSNQEMLQAMLPVIDDFDRAIKQLEKNDDQSALEGVKIIYNKFYNILSEKGLKKVDTKIGDDFNIDFHEAITQIPAPEESLKNKIVDVIETGYTLNDKVIRYTKVVVGK